MIAMVLASCLDVVFWIVDVEIVLGEPLVIS
jgi:hypothetical protein